MSQPGWLKQQKSTFSQIWRPEVQANGIVRFGLSRGLPPRPAVSSQGFSFKLLQPWTLFVRFPSLQEDCLYSLISPSIPLLWPCLQIECILKCQGLFRLQCVYLEGMSMTIRVRRTHFVSIHEWKSWHKQYNVGRQNPLFLTLCCPGKYKRSIGEGGQEENRWRDSQVFSLRRDSLTVPPRQAGDWDLVGRYLLQV